MYKKVIFALMLLSVSLPTFAGKKKKDKAQDSCLPQPVSGIPRVPKGIHRNVMFNLDVNENGDVSNIKLVSSSGDRKVDQQLFEELKSAKFKERPGCGVYHVPLNLMPQGL